jgi:hypothetical protein
VGRIPAFDLGKHSGFSAVDDAIEFHHWGVADGLGVVSKPVCHIISPEV